MGSSYILHALSLSLFSSVCASSWLGAENALRGSGMETVAFARHLGSDCDSATDVVQNLRNDKNYLLFLAYLFGFTLFLSAIICTSIFLGRRLKPLPPSYWSIRESWNPRKFFSDAYRYEVDVTSELKDQMQELFDATTDPNKMGKGRDGSWATHRGFEILRVTRIEDGRLWTRYLQYKSRVLRWKQDLFKKKGLIESDDLRTGVRKAAEMIEEANELTAKHLGSFLNLDVNRCEVMLFHGCPGLGARNEAGEVLYKYEEQSPVGVVKRQGFDDRLGSIQGMLGSGTYFANMASKADCYGGRYNSITGGYTSVGETATMFLARVVMGTPYLTRRSLEQLRRPPCVQGHFDVNLTFRNVTLGSPWTEKGVEFQMCEHPRFDSVISSDYIDGQKKLYNEFVVYDKQSYPEFCITYRRVAKRPKTGVSKPPVESMGRPRAVSEALGRLGPPVSEALGRMGLLRASATE